MSGDPNANNETDVARDAGMSTVMPGGALRRAAVIAAVCGLVLLPGVPVAGAATIDAACAPVPTGQANLTSAINQANAQAGADTVRLAPGCTYQLTTVNNNWYGPNALPPIASDITINGRGARISRFTLDPNPSPPYMRLFFVGADPGDPDTEGYTTPGPGRLTLRDVTLSGGDIRGGDSELGGAGAGMGGAVFNQGELNLERVTIDRSDALGGNAANAETSYWGAGGMGSDASNPEGTTLVGLAGGFGGPIPPDGTGSSGGIGSPGPSAVPAGGGGFRAVDDGFDGNNATKPGGGGGPFTGLGGGSGTRSGNGSGAGGTSNYALGRGGDGGAFGRGSAAVEEATGSVTLATGGGGGIGSGGTSPGGSGGFGGGGALTGYCAPGADGGGYGGFGAGGGMPRPNCAGGKAGFGGGNGTLTPGDEDPGFDDSSGGGGAGMGGAIFNMQGEVSIVNSTIAENLALGGHGRNVGVGFQGAASGFGGALFNLNGQVLIESSTLAGNVAEHGDGGPDQGGAIYNVAHDASVARQARVIIRRSIVAGNAGSANDITSSRPSLVASGQPNNGAANVNIGTRNVITVTQTAGSGTFTGTALSANPQLGPLQDNGGLTKTMAPAPTSPAIDLEPDTFFCPDTDQRGVGRAQDEGCDTGAVELDEIEPSVLITVFPAEPSNDSTPTFRFLADEPSLTFECRFDSAAFGPCSDPYPPGFNTSAHTPAVPLGHGPHSFEVRATDVVGNVGPSDHVDFELDLIAPEGEILDGPARVIETNKEKIPVKFEFGGEDAAPRLARGAAGLVSFRCKLDRKPARACQPPSKRYRVKRGRHKFKLLTTDAAGNTDTTAFRFRVKSR